MPGFLPVADEAIANPMGLFEPETLAVRVRADSQDFMSDRIILRGLRPWGKWQRLATALPGPLRPEAFDHMQQEGALTHELIHLFQHVGTPLGLAVDALWRASSILFAQSARALADKYGFLRKPIYPWLLERAEMDDAYWHFESGLSTELIREVLLGMTRRPLPAMARERALASAPEVLRRIEAKEIDAYWIETLWDRVGANDFAEDLLLAVPESRHGSIGGLALWEGWARWMECHYLRGGWQEPAHWSRRYAAAPHVFAELTGFEVFPPGIHPTPGGLTFLALCDVAGQTPLHPIFQPLCVDSGSMTWHDFHPGWRFLTACKAVKEVDPLCTAAEPDAMADEAVANYQAFTDALCQACGWPSSVALAQRGTRLADPDWPWRDLYRKACELRLRIPAVFALSDLMPEAMQEAEVMLPMSGTGISMLYGWTVMTPDALFVESSAGDRIRILGAWADLIYQLAFIPGDFVITRYPEIQGRRRPRREAEQFAKSVSQFLESHFGIDRDAVRIDDSGH